MFDFESNLGSDLGNQPELSVLEQQGSSGGQAHSRIRTVMTMRCVVEGGVHITLGASPKHILLHFPNKWLHFPNQILISPMPLCQKLKSKFTILRFVSSFGLNSVQNVLGGLRTDVTLATRVSLETFLTTCVLLGLYFPHVRFYECVK